MLVWCIGIMCVLVDIIIISVLTSVLITLFSLYSCPVISPVFRSLQTGCCTKKYSQQLRPLTCRDPTERIFITFWVSFILLILSLTRHTESSFGTHLTRKLFLSKLKVINFPFLFQQQQEWRRRRHTCYQKNFTRKLLSLSRIIPDCSEIFQAEPNVLSTMNSNPEINKVCQF